MKIVVLDADTLGRDLDLSPLSDCGEVQIYGGTSPDQITERLDGADAVLVNKVKLNSVTLAGNVSLRLICVAATGYDNIDIPYCRERGIAVCNVVGYSTDSVAQLTVAMALSLCTHIPEYTASVSDGRYTSGGVANRLTPVYHELSGKTWGIVGYGNIGKKVAEIARAFGCRVLAYKRHPDAPECVDLQTLLRESDIISLHTPLNAESRGMIGKAELALTDKKPIIINVARGAVWDESAVAEALTDGTVSGIGCDVYSTEPFPAEHPFFAIKDLPNVCLTPHMAWGSYEARCRCLSEIVKNIEAFKNGEIRSRVDLI